MVYLKVESTDRGLMADLTISLAFSYVQDVFVTLLSYAVKLSDEPVTLCLSNRFISGFCQKNGFM